mmetsp:Transcript_19336/g.34915  ORF Transcript_19336/g.34915 Transcript_19336/m.34915 type:complete len:434 (-) Transcript_19336:553-1854(-)|eukprot:CAMPEP_0175067002 /NCGR_PEP_ID=MMETSP0052_2-20121109/16838_1 /TAXON_ID=51329 ORGANISM="Polytomella parva, Strain SAG 63-3" /NCGR_SAMPLE_ID=MMETSP0052_2 /ASSEMBLY_ACC=CAM_ASM_000194 /LENGTH=433 /DNA_ID=CAMNT_0016333799 /DNA_START=53 /DNA_END=1354 /DNA_ORIENTATION=-
MRLQRSSKYFSIFLAWIFALLFCFAGFARSSDISSEVEFSSNDVQDNDKYKLTIDELRRSLNNQHDLYAVSQTNLNEALKEIQNINSKLQSATAEQERLFDLVTNTQAKLLACRSKTQNLSRDLGKERAQNEASITSATNEIQSLKKRLQDLSLASKTGAPKSHFHKTALDGENPAEICPFHAKKDQVLAQLNVAKQHAQDLTIRIHASALELYEAVKRAVQKGDSSHLSALCFQYYEFLVNGTTHISHVLGRAVQSAASFVSREMDEHAPVLKSKIQKVVPPVAAKWTAFKIQILGSESASILDPMARILRQVRKGVEKAHDNVHSVVKQQLEASDSPWIQPLRDPVWIEGLTVAVMASPVGVVVAVLLGLIFSVGGSNDNTGHHVSAPKKKKVAKKGKVEEGAVAEAKAAGQIASKKKKSGSKSATAMGGK